MTDRFVQLHYITSYPASLLNRDDVGFAKRIPFGGAVRTRISSQCQKRHWRTFVGENDLASLGEPMSIRSRLTFERYVVEPLVAEGLAEALVRAATEVVMAGVLGESAKAKKAKDGSDSAKGKKSKESSPDDSGDSLQTGQITVLGRAEVEYLRGLARELSASASDPKQLASAAKAMFDRDVKENLASLKRASGLDAALFGRMVTSDLLAQGDAAVHVAHAFTVHAEASESDYFSAVDDLLQEAGEKGSGHIGSAELTSGLFYGYVVVDVPLLVSNLEGCERAAWQTADRTLAGEVIRRLVHLVATVSPGAKLGSTAPHSYASCVLAELGSSQPRTLANAFLDPLPMRGDVMSNTTGRLGAHVAALDRMYGTSTRRAVATLSGAEALLAGGGDALSLPALATWISDAVRQA